MAFVSGYLLTNLLYNSKRSRIFRGRRKSDNVAVIVKLAADDYPSPETIHRLQHEYDIARIFDNRHIVRYLALEPYEHALAVIEEDCGLISLADYLPEEGIDLSSFLPIALQLSQALEVIHQHQIIHKDICPRNILIHPDTQEIKISDFGISSQLHHETQHSLSLRMLEGSLPYLSPEQTGRMNRTLDYRGDFYSLGATFYQLLTGRLPYTASDTMGWVHCHVAKIPAPVNKIKRNVPPVINEIIMKLLAKNAEGRYQSAKGLMADLNRCQKELTESGSVSSFVVGLHDYAAHLELVQKLYGRDREVANLLQAFDRVVSGSAEIVMVSGYSGIGKTSLVQEVHKSIVRKRGYYASGKCDQYQVNSPYSVVITALRGLIKLLLTESDESLNDWSDKLLGVLGNNGQLIIDVIPELELIIDAQPAVPNTGPTEAENRFHNTFLQFLGAFAQQEHPLVLFLDDLQWVDSASLKLLNFLMTDPGSRYLLCIGAYRDNEVDELHPLLITLNKMREENVRITNLTLSPLKQKDIQRLLADSLGVPFDRVASLSYLAIKKTAGNPFFCKEFFKTLEQDRQLRFDADKKSWVWDVDKIELQGITDNVVELMVANIRKLPKATQESLQLGACIGNRFDLRTLATINECDVSQMVANLWPAVETGLLLPLEKMNPIQTAGKDSSQTSAPVLNTLYKFLHDRVQQAAYEEIPDIETIPIHLRIGRLLLENTPEERMPDWLFTIIEQLNSGRGVIQEARERNRLAGLNLQAGIRARESGAYQAAARYFAIGIELLPEGAWNEFYELTFNLKLKSAETAYLSGDFATSERLYPEIQQHALTVLDQIDAFEVQIEQYQLQGRYREALEIQKEGLALLGWPIPEEKSDLQNLIDIEIGAIEIVLADHAIESLAGAPEMNDPKAFAKLVMLQKVFATAYLLGMPALMNLSQVKMTQLSLQYGNAELSSLAYVHFGEYLCWNLNDFDAGYRFGSMAVDLAKRTANPTIICRVNHCFAAFISPWNRSVDESISYFETGLEAAKAAGDWVYQGYSMGIMTGYKFIKGNNLEQVFQQSVRYMNALNRVHNREMSDWILVKVVQPILQLQGQTNSQFTFDSLSFSEEDYIHEYASKPVQLAAFYLSKLRNAYYFDDRGSWEDLTDKLDLIEKGLPEQIDIADGIFYASLMLLERCSGGTSDEQARYRRCLESLESRIKVWAHSSPETFSHKYTLIEAEKAQLSGDPLRAMALYDTAIEMAGDSRFMHMEALCNELYGKFWLRQGRHRIAQLYLQEARYLYLLWGASAKAVQLQDKYPELFVTTPRLRGTSGEVASATDSSDSSSASMDLLSITKAAQAISSDIDFRKLLTKVIRIIIENAGAQRGVLILLSEDKLKVQAAADTLEDRVEVLQDTIVEDQVDIPQSVIHYVYRTGESVVLGSREERGPFDADPYFQASSVESTLCIPVRQHDEITGVLYLENETVASAFDLNRIEVLELLLAQAAISLENARLFTDAVALNRQLLDEIKEREQAESAVRQLNIELEQRVKQRTMELQVSNQNLQQAKEEAIAVAKHRAEFLSKMSHEIRTPLNGVMGMIELTLDSRLTEEQQRQLNMAYNSGAALQGLLNDILDLAKVESGKMSLERVDFDLRLMVEELATLFAQTARDKPIDVICQVDPRFPERIKADPTRIRQVITNLVGNAIKFTHQGEVTIETDVIDNDNKGYQVRLQVRDTGIGISASGMENLFKPFSQASNDTTRKFGGTGLGLNLCKQLVELMRGKISVSSEVDVGSNFTVEFPAEKSESVPVFKVDPRITKLQVLQLTESPTANHSAVSAYLEHWQLPCRLLTVDNTQTMNNFMESIDENETVCVVVDSLSLAKKQRAISGLPMAVMISMADRLDASTLEKIQIKAMIETPIHRQNLYESLLRVAEIPIKVFDAEENKEGAGDRSDYHILLAEDNNINQMVAMGFLKKLGLSTTLAENGREAVEAVRKHPYDLVLMDCQMPIMDGFEATHAIRLIPGLENLPIIALSASMTREDQIRCQEVGMNDFLAKPLKRSDLKNMLDKWLALKTTNAT